MKGIPSCGPQPACTCIPFDFKATSPSILPWGWDSWRAQVSGLEREYAAAIQACRAKAEAATERATQEAAATQARAASKITALLARASEAEARAGGALLAAEAAADARYSSLAQQLDQMKGEAGAASLHAGLAQRERAGLAAALRREQERSKSLEAVGPYGEAQHACAFGKCGGKIALLCLQ